MASSGDISMMSVSDAIDAVADPPEKSIWTAATVGRADCIAAHLAAGVPPDARDDAGFTPM